MKASRSKVEHTVTQWLNGVTAALMALLSVAIFTTVLARYVFRASIPELVVLTRLCIAWLVFLGGALAVRNDDHLAIDIFGPYLSPRANRYRRIVLDALVTFAIVLFVVVGYRAFIVGLSRVERIRLLVTGKQISLAYFNTAFVVGAVLMFAFQVLNLIDRHIFHRSPKKE